MTMQPPTLGLPELNPDDPVQMYCYFTAWMYAVGDPQDIEESDREIGEWAARVTQEALDDGMAGIGAEEGDRAERLQAYIRKYQWPTAVDPQTGALLHAVMTQQPVLDPKTGGPTGQMQPVPSSVGEDLWQLQLQMFPRQFLKDAKDAFEIGAPLPQWVMDEVIAIKQHEQTTEGKKALKSAVEPYKAKKALVAP